ncbi:MAG: cysteine dioxygenase [Thermoanaerobaculia bacterium]
MTLPERIQELLSELAARIERPTPESVLMPVAREMEPYVGCARYSAERYMRHPVFMGPDWEVMLIAWETGQKTPIHDHRGVMGSMLVFSGSLVEETFDTPEDKPALLDRSDRGAGDACLTSPTLLHRLFPRKGRSLSLHIYRPPLREMGIWEPQGMTEIRASGYDVPVETLSARTAKLA